MCPLKKKEAKWREWSVSRSRGASWDGNVERGTWDVVLAPFHHQDVVSSLLQHVTDVVLQVPQVFDQDFLTGDVGAVHANQEHVLTWRGAGGIKG